MAARVKSIDKTKKTKTNRTSAVRKDSDTSKNTVSKSRLTRKQKLIVAGGALLAIALLIGGRGLFVAATVNGVPVSRIEIIRELEKQRGQQMLESIINEKLIYQEARKASVSVSTEEINKEIEDIRGQMASQGQDLDIYLSSQGFTQELFEEQIKLQLTLEKILADRLSVSEEDINTFLETNSEFLPDLSEEELKELAKGELEQQKLSSVVPAWLEEVKANSNINYIVEY